MKIAKYRYNGTEQHGVIKEEQIFPVKGDIYGEYQVADSGVPLKDVQLLAPIAPRKLIAIGLNYALHAKESNKPLPDEPMMFMCSPNAIIGPEDTIELDNNQDRIDFEAEIAIVINKKAKNVKAKDAFDYVLGYTCANDVSNRDLQKKDIQYTRAKSFDTYKPLGPWIETDLKPNELDIKLWQNGELRQSSNTNDMIFHVDKLIEFVSHVMTLEQGDIIITGTPSGVGPMKTGDVIEIEIEGIGKLTNHVK